MLEEQLYNTNAIKPKTWQQYCCKQTLTTPILIGYQFVESFLVSSTTKIHVSNIQLLFKNHECFSSHNTLIEKRLIIKLELLIWFLTLKILNKRTQRDRAQNYIPLFIYF